MRYGAEHEAAVTKISGVGHYNWQKVRGVVQAQ
jgi:hypothetical protein